MASFAERMAAALEAEREPAPEMVVPAQAPAVRATGRIPYIGQMGDFQHETPESFKSKFRRAAQYGQETLQNIPGSAMKFGHDIIQPVVHPIDTATNLYDLGKGLVQMTGIDVGGDESKAAAVGKFFSDRYGGIENIKNTIKKDPVGALADVSVILSGGGTLAARAPGAIGKLGKVASKAGASLDPLTMAMRGGKASAKLATHAIGGLGTHTGGASLMEAFKAGSKGGNMGRAFAQNMRGNVSPVALVEDARAALSKMRQDRSTEYLKGMRGVKADATVLDFTKVQKAVDDVSEVGKYKGVSINQPAAEIWSQIDDVVGNWAKLDPSEYHTAAGIDALKQSIGKIRDATPPHTPARVVANDVYRNIRSVITNHAPDYANIMKGYEEASDLIGDIEKTLSLGEKASIDTALRKLTSVMRNNVNTTYGRRVQLAEKLAASGSNQNIMAGIAGQTLNTLTPRGLGPLVGAATLGAGYLDPRMLAALPFQSPRLMGEAYHGAGILNRYLPPEAAARSLGQGAYQTGRIPQTKKENRP